MNAARWLLFLLLLASGFFATPDVPFVQAETRPTLRVCLEENSGLYSFKRGSQYGGFDVLVAEAVAARLSRELVMQWFESEHDEEHSPARDVNALLSHGVCDLVGGYALFRGALGNPGQPAATLPDYAGRKRSERGTFVKLGVLVASRPYLFAPFTVVLSPDVSDRRIDRLSDLGLLRLGSEVSTLASAILSRYQSGLFVNQIVHFTRASGLLSRLEAGEFDATLIELHRFDAYRARHPQTRLQASPYRHPIGFNMGFAALETSRLLLTQVNQALDALHAEKQLGRLARRVGLTYVAPREPAILERLTPSMLLND